MIEKRFILLMVFSLLINLSHGQAPEGYYDEAEGLSGAPLRIALYNTIRGHSSQTYNSLWTHFQQTDQKENGKVWDMYSTRTDGSFDYEYTFIEDQCGNYSGEGSCYNREHSFPKSWFDDEAPMSTDLFHLYPTDGYTNGKRGNYAFGEVASASWTSTNGSKKGASSYDGYSGIVFEPIDTYKGDFARTYFYMLTRYQNRIEEWDSPMLEFQDFSDWAKQMLLEWHENDPVSDKEIERNNEVYNIQNNRNPFIDHPEFALQIWDPSQKIISTTINVDLKLWYFEGFLYWNQTFFQNGTLSIFNIAGQVIGEKVMNLQKGSFALNLEKGIYIVEYQSEINKVLKIVIP